ncbi:MAG: hypothetical protein Tsb0034_03280 [Ekhidna sp.]
MRYGISLVTLFLTHFLFAQQKCGTTAPTDGEFENWINIKLEANKRLNRIADPNAPVYQIPVVVHVFHNGEPVGTGRNLGNERIFAQIDSLNADFRRTNADRINTPEDFLPVAADTEIEFVMARRNPKGNPTNGIVRVRGEKGTYRINSDKLQLRSESHWSPNDYLNIYVGDFQNFIGYAAFPVTDLVGITNESDDFELDAVYVDYEYFGNNPDAPTFESRGRTLTHEMGHFLGLRHIWGDAGCSGDDFVMDTPTARFDHGGTTSPCTYPIPDNVTTTLYDEGNTCTEEDDPDLPDMFQNYMDYTDDICMNLFTLGQRNRMRIVLENSPRRSSLINSPALIAPVQFTKDLAASRVISPGMIVCEEQITPEVEIVNYGTVSVESFDVTLYIEGNPIGSPVNIDTPIDPLERISVSFPDVVVNTTQTAYEFRITNIDGGLDDRTTNNTINHIIEHVESTNVPFFQTFETANQLVGNIGVNQPWQVEPAPQESAFNNALVLTSFDYEGSTKTDILSTPPLDLSGFEAIELSFDYAYAYKENALYDGLEIWYSYNCGLTYESEPLFSAFGPDLSTVPYQTDSEFTPASSTEWLSASLLIPRNSITDSYGNEVLLAFVGFNGMGNNLFIDNIRIRPSNRISNDASIVEVEAPPVTCAQVSPITISIKNVGTEPINQIELDYTVVGNTSSISFSDVSIGIDDMEQFSFEVPTPDMENEILVEIIEVNQARDEGLFKNDLQFTILLNTLEDNYPFVTDFQTVNDWVNTSRGNSVWEHMRFIENDNGALRANAFQEIILGEDSWFISPALSDGGLDSVGLYFRASYASRLGRTDRLRVLASVDCGNSYPITLLDADSDSLAVTTMQSQWTPENDDDWKEFRLDMSSVIPIDDKVRIAFVFTNGNGNDLYIDDISIQANEPPTYEDVFRVFPNPATINFNIGFNLPEKEPVTVELWSMNGRLHTQQKIPNALNQILLFEAPNHAGLYFIRVIGSNFAETQKLYIDPN